MEDPAFPWAVQALGFVAATVLLGGGVALSRGVPWMFAVGIPLPVRTERIDLVLPDGLEGDPSDPIDRLYAFDLDDYQSAFWLSPTRIGLLYWGVSFGARNTLRIRVLRGAGVLATGLVDIERGPEHTIFRWRPFVRVGPLAVLAGLVAVSSLPFGSGGFMGPVVAVWMLMYLGLLLWTLRRLPAVYEAVSAQLVSMASGMSRR